MDFLEISGTRLECRRVGPGPEDAPTIVFLHEGLGSVSTWRDFPDALAAETGCGALVYSRAGYGRSDPVPLPRPVRFMHDEARVLVDVLARAGIRSPILLGHSDGASVALIAAGTETVPGLRALVLEAPHTFAEPCGLESIAKIVTDSGYPATPEEVGIAAGNVASLLKRYSIETTTNPCAASEANTAGQLANAPE